MASASSLDSSVAWARRRADEVVIDLEGLEFMDCAGLRVLLAWAADDNGAVSVTPGSPQVQRVFELSGTAELLRVVSPSSPALRRAA